MLQIKIAISTNINFYKLTLPIIIQSLIKSGIESSNIHVFNGGFNEYKFEIVDGISYHFLDHNSYEYAPLIEICDKELESDYWFLIHDTCKVGDRFKDLLYNIPPNMPEKLALKSRPSMCMGTYKYSYLLTLKEKLLSIKNKDYSEESMIYWKNWAVYNEDFIMWMNDPQPIIYNNNNEWSIVTYENWYGTNTERRTEYYPSLDIYKNKSNWGQSPNYKKEI